MDIQSVSIVYPLETLFNSVDKSTNSLNMMVIPQFLVTRHSIDWIKITKAYKISRKINIPGHQMENNEEDMYNEIFCYRFDL